MDTLVARTHKITQRTFCVIFYFTFLLHKVKQYS